MNISRHKKIYTRQEGYVTLLGVVILGAVGVGITVSLLALGTSNTQTSLSYQELTQARTLADTCAEVALQEIRDDDAYTGTDNLSLGQGSCSFIVTNGGGENRSIDAEGVVGGVTQRVEVEVNTINPQILITSWRQVADF